MTMSVQQVPGVYHRPLGEFLVTALSDGYVDQGYGIFRDLSNEAVDELMARDHGVWPARTSVNCFLIRGPNYTALVDCGSQDKMGPTCGRLFENLEAAGVGRDEVDYILLTHAHPDHSCGLTDVKTGERPFPKAQVIVNAKEVAHWFSDEEMEKADERKRLRYFSWAREQLGPYRENHMRTCVDGEEILPGITVAECAGHTPGHSAYVLKSGDKQLVVWGDLVHIPEIQLRRPDVAMIFDYDPQMAIETRRELLKRIMAEDMLVAGMHIHFPGFGWLREEGEGCRVAADQWAFAL